MGLDFSRFDQTISRDVLRIFEQYVLVRPFPTHTKFQTLVKLAECTTGVSRFGTRYFVEGTRCSGDAWTSIMNGLLNRFLVWVCLKKLPLNSWRSVHEGDDGMIGIKESVKDQVLYNMQFLGCLGFETKIEISTDISSLTFCGRRLYYQGGELADMADVTRAMKKFNTTVSIGDSAFLLYAKALSYNYTDQHTPLIGALTYAIATVLGPIVNRSRGKMRRYIAKVIKERWLLCGDSGAVRWKRLLHVRPPCVHPAAYATVVLHDNIPLRAILDLEQEYMSWIEIGYIPNEISKLLLDWVPLPSDAEEIGDPGLHHM